MNPTRNKYGFASDATEAERLAITDPFPGQLIWQSDADSGMWLYDGSVWGKVGGGNFIPITGTNENDPVTGPLEINTVNGTGIVNTSGFMIIGSADNKDIDNEAARFGALLTVSGQNSSQVAIRARQPGYGEVLVGVETGNTNRSVTIGAPEDSPGMVGTFDFSPNYTNLSYVQAGWVLAQIAAAGGDDPQGLEPNRLVGDTFAGTVNWLDEFENSTRIYPGSVEVAYEPGGKFSQMLPASVSNYDNGSETTLGIGEIKHGGQGATLFKIKMPDAQNPTNWNYPTDEGDFTHISKEQADATYAPIGGGGITDVTGASPQRVTVADDGSGGRVVDLADDVVLKGNLDVPGNAEIFGNLTAYGDIMLDGPVMASGKIQSDDFRYGSGVGTPFANNDGVIPSSITQDATHRFVSDSEKANWNAKANDADVVHKTGSETIAGVKTFSSSPIVPDATTSGQAVNKGQLDGKQPVGDYVRRLISDANPYSVTGVITETKIFSAPVAVNNGDYWDFVFQAYRTGISGNVVFKVYLNSSDAVGGTLLGTFTQATTNLVQGNTRHWSFSGGNVRGINPIAGGSPSDMVGSNQAALNSAFPSGNVFFVISATPSSSADVITVQGIKLHR